MDVLVHASRQYVFARSIHRLIRLVFQAFSDGFYGFSLHINIGLELTFCSNDGPVLDQH